MGRVISNWSDLSSLHDELAQTPEPLAFRGQSSDRPLSTSFERLATRYAIPSEKRRQREEYLVREFQRHYHRFGRDLPNEDDRVRWLSLMQHHGAPTRALDFTYSFWVAVFFALENLEPQKHGSIWWLAWRRAYQIAEQEIPEVIAELRRDSQFGKSPALVSQVLGMDVELVLTFSPHALDERLAIQQGLHLLPLTLRTPLAEIITRTLPEAVLGHAKICLGREELVDILGRLQRMNIERRVLFPGLDGLAQGLKHRMALEHLFPLE